MPPRSIYLHVPFCIHHCGYCDFTVLAGRDDLMSGWLSSLRHEIEHTTQRVAIDTVFIGGGTPTHLPPDLLRQLLELIHERFDVATDAEFSIEANPDGLTRETLAVLSEHKVNRISLGVQSFDDACLRVLERTHTRDSAVEAIRNAAAVIRDVSVDLIFAVPGQSLASWDESLALATSLPVTHLSTYGLTWETGTQFVAREKRGQISRVSDELEREMYQLAIGRLDQQRFTHYEVSNFARDGRECRHNHVYWNADEYYGVGPGAARYVDGTRSTNSRNVMRWIKSWQEGRPCLDMEETLSPEERAREAIMLALRLRRGLNIDDFERRFRISLNSIAADAVARHADAGNLETSAGWIRLTNQGLMIADTVVGDFL
jgi:oxygen-independent coproporphyrinogen-3 oxidase